jgi:hypothetical protein
LKSDSGSGPPAKEVQGAVRDNVQEVVNASATNTDTRAETIAPASGDQGAENTATLVTNGGAFALATAFQQIMGLEVSAPPSLPTWLAKAAAWVVPPAKSPLSTLWNTPGAGLPPTASVAIASSSDGSVLAVSAESQIRLVSTSSGTFLTPLFDVSNLSNCGGPIISVSIMSDLSITVRTANCVATRLAPLTLKDLESAQADPSPYLGGGTAISPMLPGEQAVSKGAEGAPTVRLEFF